MVETEIILTQKERNREGGNKKIMAILKRDKMKKFINKSVKDMRNVSINEKEKKYVRDIGFPFPFGEYDLELFDRHPIAEFPNRLIRFNHEHMHVAIQTFVGDGNCKTFEIELQEKILEYYTEIIGNVSSEKMTDKHGKKLFICFSEAPKNSFQIKYYVTFR